MAEYKIKEGHNVDFSLLEFVLQEPSGGIAAPVVRDYGAGNALHEQALYVVFHWDYIDDEAAYHAILEQFGVNDQDEAEVTIWARSPRLVWTRYNGIAYYPEAKQDMKINNFFIRDVDLYICDLKALPTLDI